MTNDEFIIHMRLSEMRQRKAQHELQHHQLYCAHCKAADLFGSWCELLGKQDHSYEPCAEWQRLEANWKESRRLTVAAWGRVKEVPENERMGRSAEYEARLLAPYLKG